MSNDSIYGAVMQAVREIERNGRLRSQLRRAGSSREAFGLAEATKFDLALRFALSEAKAPLPRDKAIPDECLILIAQRNVQAGKAGPESRFPPLAALLGGREEADRALSGLRFQRLISAQAGDDRLRQMRRALALLKQPAHPIAVVEAYLALHTEVGARRFANHYFQGLTTTVVQPAIGSPNSQGITP